MSDDSVLRLRASRGAGIIGVLFGLVTLAAGVSVLAGRDPGYSVYRPLLVFNTVMGVLYVVAGVMAWRRARLAWMAAAGIAAANLLALAYIALLYRAGGPAAPDSVRAMLFRSGIWLMLLLFIVRTRGASHRGTSAR
jgi:CHASE2 domain-containing sensor protein